MTLVERIERVREQIEAACARAGRSSSTVTLIAVSKTHPPELILRAIDAGLQHFGENRVEEAEAKIPAVAASAGSSPVWHMIGHVQSRKAKRVIDLFATVHSVDSVKLASKFSQLAEERGTTLDIFLEMNVSGEASKHGFAAAGWETDVQVREALWKQVSEVLALPCLNVRGLMTMAPIVADPEEARPVFASLAGLRAALSEMSGAALPDLSMGMTDDFPVAIEEGATLIRVGRAIFGERET
ncbi:MAG: YggS family pyridoxal phosphate-dependent enzyme [Chloroflexota bacterium]|nr:MAG: YggS family pyridoxal phosphate-dependent enzyme [Chloroflexota bacterium]